MDATPNLVLPYIMAAQAQKHVTHNEALRTLDALVQIAVSQRGLTTAPAAPADGERFLVGAGATDAFAGHSDKIAAFQDGAWVFFTPGPGWLAYVTSEALFVAWDGTAWTPFGDIANAGLSRLGINAVADDINRLAIRSSASLFDNEGTGHQLKLNKAGAGDTATLLLQTNYSGRGEIGLSGDDALRIKVSADGATWREAFRADPASGDAILGNLRVSRDMQPNLLPDSGRFNGNSGNTVFAGIIYAAPSYLSAVAGGAISAHAKFIHDNSDYGGTAGALDVEVKALVDKIRPADRRRYGPEWYVARVDLGATLSEQRSVDGIAYGLALTNQFTALPSRFTVGYYAKVLSGSALVALDDATVARAAIDGVAATGPFLLQNQDGWKHVGLQALPNGFGYNYRAFQLLATSGASLLIAMPKVLFGHADLDPDAGVIMNARLFG